MNIILKQAEIEKALQQYLLGQGVVLRNKHMVVDFTSGRGDRGLSASITIEDVDIPGFTNMFPAIDNALQPATNVQTAVEAKVESDTTEVAPEAVQPVAQADEASEAPAQADTPVAEPEPVVEEAAPVVADPEPLVEAETSVPTEEVAAPKTTTSLFG